MTLLRKHVHILLLGLFCWYYCGINFSSHVHLINGVSLVHSHPGATESHSHSDDQFSLIDIITCFLAVCPETSYHLEDQRHLNTELKSFYHPINLNSHIHDYITRRGPPHMP